MRSVERFEIREIDRALLDSECDRILRRIREMLPFATVMEVGSTAVEGVLGKQDLDLLVQVPQDRFTEARSVLDHVFPRNERQLSDEEFQGYLVTSPLDVSVQLTIKNGRHDVFEDFVVLLRSDPELRRAYNELKVAWNRRPMEEYRAAKNDFIAKALAGKKAK